MTLGKTSTGKLELPENVVNGLDWIRSTHLTLSRNNTSWYRKQALEGKKFLAVKARSRLVTSATVLGQTPGLVPSTLLTPSLDASELKLQKSLATECEKQLVQGGLLKGYLRKNFPASYMEVNLKITKINKPNMGSE